MLLLPLCEIGMLAFEVQARPKLRALLSSTPLSFAAVGCLLV
ncbi:hypothetical protein [Novosphingobium sp.]|nr:hypothetical protein [Novosphingobium sp.]